MLNLILAVALIGGSNDTIISIGWDKLGLYVPAGEDAGLPIGVSAFGIGADGNIYLYSCASRTVWVFDMDGGLKRTVETSIPCAWDITANTNGDIYMLVFTSLKNQSAYVWVKSDRLEWKIAIPDEFVEARGNGRLHATADGKVYLEMFFDGRWHSVELREGMKSVEWFDLDGRVGWDGEPLRSTFDLPNAFDRDVNGCVYSVERGFTTSIRKDCENGKSFKGDWIPKMVTDFYDDPYAVSSDGKVFVVITDSKGVKILRLNLSDDTF
ncbi:MAG: hypothetical protein DRQ10_03445 [Candidatus Hydrothermota bacterium]|nr:MAG: hypothetical protein DRQ10_03445 [Candidatus Hydrothermae bacterium]